ncbi:MAG TPA: CHAP domain-containing protein [Streptosporangiaceae bacterium]|jgi:hypothetical protein
MSRCDKARRGLAAGIAVLAAVALAGVQTYSADASSETLKVVFQDNDNVLAGYSSSGSSFTTTYGMMAGTSPAVTELANGTYEAAFEANTDDLAVNELGGGVVTTSLGMDKGTSPAIAGLPAGGWVAAFQDNDNKLYIYTSSGDKINTDLGMDPGTSPSIAVQTDGTYKVVFQDNDNVLAGYNSSGSNYTTADGMEPGTSPAIAAKPDGSYEIAVEANDSDLSTIHLGDGYSTNNTTLGMDAGTSPAVAVQADGTFGVVFQDNDNVLAGYWSDGSNYTTADGMKAGTSPAIGAEPDGTYEVAVEANDDDLSTIHLGDGYSTNNTTLGMDASTGPALATQPPQTAPEGLGTRIVGAAQSEVGYLDSPADSFCNKFSTYWNEGTPTDPATSGDPTCGPGTSAEEWCADFAAWTWDQAGASFTYGFGSGDINAGAISFYDWAVANGTWHAAGSGYAPQPGDAVVYASNTSSAQHVGIVTGGTASAPNTINGDFGHSEGSDGVEAVDGQSSVAGVPILGYASPVS